MDIKNNKGITLMALVITIILIMILAGITMSTFSDKEGPIQGAQNYEAGIQNTFDRIDNEVGNLYNVMVNK